MAAANRMTSRFSYSFLMPRRSASASGSAVAVIGWLTVRNQDQQLLKLRACAQMLCYEAESCAVPVPVAVAHIHQPVTVLIVHRIKFCIGVKSNAACIRGMPVNGDRDTEAFTEIIKDNGSLSCMCHPVTPTHRTTLVNQEGNSQTFFLSWKSGSGKDGSVCLIESMGVQTFSKQEILLLSALLFFFQKRQDGALQLFGSPQERGSNVWYPSSGNRNTGQAMG